MLVLAAVSDVQCHKLRRAAGSVETDYLNGEIAMLAPAPPPAR